MFNISKILEHISKKVHTSHINQTHIYDIVNTITHLAIPHTCFEIKNGILYIQTSPVFKNKIHINKNSILKRIESEYPRVIHDIR